MGLLSKGTPLDWISSIPYQNYVKQHGIIQFLSIYHQMYKRRNDVFLWGDEIEHFLIVFDHLKKTVKLSTRAPEIIQQLETLNSSQSSSETIHNQTSSQRLNASFVPEWGCFMIEATPARPYGGYTSDLRMVQPNMQLRREIIRQFLLPNETLITVTSFPSMGAGYYIEASDFAVKGEILQSLYAPDVMLSPHPRFATLAQNIRARRGSKVCIRVPLFIDKNTIETQKILIDERSNLTREERESDLPIPSKTVPGAFIPPEPDCSCHPKIDEYNEIHMDAMGFGMGCCCAQVTFQTRSIGEARHLYDQLAVLSPIMLALTAASPFWRGRVSNQDVRWNVISQSVDDRTLFERGFNDSPLKPQQDHCDSKVRELGVNSSKGDQAHLKSPKPKTSIVSPTRPSSNPLNASALSTELPIKNPIPPQQRLSKSRYDSISTYICNCKFFRPEYNDIPCEVDKIALEQLKNDPEVDDLLARHIAHLFVRQPLVIYDESIVLDDTKTTEHFENLQSTNWQSVRFKPPPINSTIGWRVEFRTMEVQLTDFENAAFTVFVALISRAILYFDLNLYIPLSKVDENFKIAHCRDAVNTQKFWWRKQIKSCASDVKPPKVEEEHEKQTIAEILCGKGETQPGLIQLVRVYLDCIKADDDTKCCVEKYLSLISQRATGKLMTAASWLRKYVDQHPLYKHNSILTPELVYELMNTLNEIQAGHVEVTQLLGKLCNCPEPKIQVDGNGIIGVDLQDERSLAEKRGSELIGSPKDHDDKEEPETARLDLKDADSCARFRKFLLECANRQQKIIESSPECKFNKEPNLARGPISSLLPLSKQQNPTIDVQSNESS